MIFLDSSFIVACKIEDDENHRKAIDYLTKIIEERYENFITSDFIFDEVVTVVFVKTKDINAAIDAGSILRVSSIIKKIDEDVFEKAWEIFKNQKNTKFSFTDCTTLALMAKERIKNIATFDKDFKKIKNIEIFPKK